MFFYIEHALGLDCGVGKKNLIGHLVVWEITDVLQYFVILPNLTDKCTSSYQLRNLSCLCILNMLDSIFITADVIGFQY